MSGAREITWVCSACGKEVADGSGYLTVDNSAVNRAELAQKEWEKQRPPGAFGERVISFGELMQQPEDVPWQVYHSACDPTPDSGSYTVDVSRARTPLQLLSWTLHFMDTKNWIKHTNWTEFVSKVSGADVSLA